MHPLTHHEILGLVGPFARRGRHVDLAASDRLERKLVFRTIEHRTGTGTSAGHRESLRLDSRVPGLHRLTRTLTLDDGMEATLVAEGSEPGALMERIDAVPHDRQILVRRDFTLALGHRVDASGALRFTHGTMRVEGLTLRLERDDVSDRHAEVALTTGLDDPLVVPDDLLAVLGWSWSRLDPRADRSMRRWAGSVRLRGWGAGTGDDAERQLERAAVHLATTLTEPPARFHDRQRGARWMFAFRRSIPLLVCVLLIVGALLFTRAGLSQDSVVRMLIFNAPPLMLVALFCLREPPRIEWPTRPRPLAATRWRPVDGDAG